MTPRIELNMVSSIVYSMLEAVECSKSTLL